jgi:ceramide glucosyltransferase
LDANILALMLISLGGVATLVFAVAALCGSAYYLLGVWGATRFLREKRNSEARQATTPPVTILKPVHGVDPGAYENFRSHCLQDYLQYEIIFTVNEGGDAAVPLIERLQREYPERSIRLAVSKQVLGTNCKVSNLIQALSQARHEYLLINDGDVRVAADYLRQVMKHFADDRVGMVTTLYSGVPAGTLGSKLEALGINTDFAAGVLVARQIEGGLRFGLGATLALRRKALEAMGGLEPLADYLADDYELGARISGAGYQVVLSDVVPEVLLPPYSFAEFFQHQLRWGRGMRSSRKGGYAGVVLTFGWLWGLVTVIASGGAPAAWGLFAAALVARFLMAVTVGKAVQGPVTWRELWLVPLRDLVALAVWIGSYTGRTVAWRGTRFVLENGKLRPAG